MIIPVKSNLTKRLGVITIHMTEVEYCLVCHKFIGLGNDPAICDSAQCKANFDCECAFNKWAKSELAKNCRQPE